MIADPAAIDARAVSELLSRIAFARELLEGASPGSRALASAAHGIRRFAGDLRAGLESGALAELPGVGRGSLALVREILEHGEPQALRELEAKIPGGLFAIHGIKGLGPAKIRALWEGLGITTLGELEHACKENRLVSLSGFGAKTQANVLVGIEALRRAEREMLRDRAGALTHRVLVALRAAGVRAVALGGVATGEEIVTALVVAAAGDDAAIDEALLRAGVHEGQIDGAPLEVVRCAADTIGAVTVVRTSEPEHLEALRARAATQDLVLADDALRDASGANVPCDDDDAFYAALGLRTTATERRLAGVPLVAIGKAAPKLIELSDLRGALHNHTVASDGTATVDQMADAAAALGLEYLGISDHSVSAAYAGGLSADDLLGQAKKIGARGAGTCVVLSGVESDIREDGTLDYDDEVLRAVDVVIASVHRRFGLDRAATTRRMVAAARHPLTDVVGHPTGRLLLGRPPNDFDVEAMIDAARESGCAIELNASPHRLDLDARQCAVAKERGVLVSIAADAHSTSELTQLEYGIAIARRGGLTAEDVLNSRSLEELRAWLAARRAASASA